MQAFPSVLEVSNKLDLSTYRSRWLLQNLRKEIYNHMLEYDYTEEDPGSEVYKTENNYFDLTNFYSNYCVKDEKLQCELYKSIIDELEHLGWNCKLSFGDTALFIYSTSKPPTSCW
jgi:hypothetical protein